MPPELVGPSDLRYNVILRHDQRAQDGVTHILQAEVADDLPGMIVVDKDGRLNKTDVRGAWRK